MANFFRNQGIDVAIKLPVYLPFVHLRVHREYPKAKIIIENFMGKHRLPMPQLTMKRRPTIEQLRRAEVVSKMQERFGVSVYHPKQHLGQGSLFGKDADE